MQQMNIEEDRRLEDERQAQFERLLKKQWRQETRRSIIAAVLTTLVILPLAGWYALIAGVVTLYHVASVMGDIRDERIGRSKLAWSAFIRMFIIGFVIVLAIAMQWRKLWIQ